MQNYHRHSSYSNISTPDSATTNEDYAKRAVELGHKVISSCEHGWQGYYFEAFELAKKYNLKFVFCAEAYWVKDREKEYRKVSTKGKKEKESFLKDDSNHHIILMAKNENGRQAINDVLSEANITGYYKKPRLDVGLILSLPPDDVVITTACIAFWGSGKKRYEDIDDIILKFFNHFKSNFFLEIQYHNTDFQKEWNSHILSLADKYGIEMIVGLDSHCIKESDEWKRDMILEAKNVRYEDENNCYMDYPDDETTLQRFVEQNVIPIDRVKRAMDNTDICLTFDDYDDVPIFNKDLKLPTEYKGYEGLTIEEKNKIYKRLIGKKFLEYMKTVPKEEYDRYYEGIKAEIQTYIDTGMVDYPLLDYEIVKYAVEHGGIITKTGRGCFTGEALVNTKSGLKCLKDVVAGDYVIDMNGEFKKVTDTMKYHINEELVKIDYLYGTVKHHENICTKDHKILALVDGDIKWTEAQNLKQGDFVCLPKMHLRDGNTNVIDLNDYNIFGYEFDDKYIYEYSPFIQNRYDYSPRELSRVFNKSKKMFENFANGKIDKFKKYPFLLENVMEYIPFNTIEEYREYVKGKRTKKIKRYLNLNYEFGEFCGLMYGDGTNQSDRNSISLAINSENHKNYINTNIFYNVAKNFGLDASRLDSKKGKRASLTFYSKLISYFLCEFLFESNCNKEKQFNNDIFEKYPNEFKNGVLKGLFLSDGCFSENSSDERLSFDNTSESLINAYKILSMNTENGILSLSVRNGGKDNRGYNRKKSYKLRNAKNPFDCVKKTERCLENDKYWFLPIKRIEILNKTETDVYDLTVEDSHSYVLNNMVVHNSAVGFMTNTLCGFSKVDRFKSAIKLYPERFISTTRILETKSLPD